MLYFVSSIAFGHSEVIGFEIVSEVVGHGLNDL